MPQGMEERSHMVLAADYPFMDILWSMIIFFSWVIWIWIMIVILTDVFRRRDIGGWAKAAWVVFLIVLPFVGALIYLIAQHDGMSERQAKQVADAQQQADTYIRSVAGSGDGAAGEIERAKGLLDSGAITQAEFDALKAKALAA
jgi:phospholipase D-like protein/putative oligomerization/nucleic acid binding protein